jgi:deoxycytidylate deaminase
VVKTYDPVELAEIISRRSSCNVRVGAVATDSYGVFAWGWNSSGPTGYGECAELHMLKRANVRRLADSTVVVYSVRRGKQICSIPCEKCMPRLKAARVHTVRCWNNDQWLEVML